MSEAQAPQEAKAAESLKSGEVVKTFYVNGSMKGANTVKEKPAQESLVQGKAKRAIKAMRKAAAAKAEAEAPTPEAQEATPAEDAKTTEPAADATEPIEAEAAPQAEAEAGAKDTKEPETDETAEAKAAEPEAAPDLKAQFSALARAEKRLREEREAFKTEQQAATKQLQRYQEIARIADENPYKLLDYLGVDVTDWAKHTLGNDAPQETVAPEVTEAQKILEEIRAERESLNQEKQQTSMAAQRNNAIAEIGGLLQNKADEYEFTLANGGAETVFETIAQHFYETQRLLSFEDAANLVEQHFEDEAEKLLGVSKFKKKLQPTQSAAASAAPKQPESRGAKANQPQENISTTAPDRVSTSRLSKKERRKRAAALLSG